MYNPWVSTSRRRSRQKEDSAATAGIGKVPRVAVNKSDLEAQAAQYGWTARPLTYTEVREMSSSELRWHEIFNAANLENALALPAKIKEGKDIDRQWAVKKLWDNQTQTTPEQAADIWNALQTFRQTYPQFLPRVENEIVLLWLKDRNMEVTFSNLVESFQANALEGKVWLNPNAINAGSETEVSGQQLLQHHSFHLLLQPQKRVSDVDRLSADEYFEKNKDILGDKRVSPFEVQRRQKAESTQAYFAQAASAEAKGNVVNVVDYGPQRHGVAPEPEKYSFKQKIRSMSASEIAARCQDDPAFRKALDELK